MQVLLNFEPEHTLRWAEYHSEEFKPKYLVRRFDDRRGNRFYWFAKDGDFVIASGITSAFGALKTDDEVHAIQKWKDENPNWRELLSASSEYGTIEHIVFGDILKKNPINYSLLDTMKGLLAKFGYSPSGAEKDVLSFLRFAEENQLEPLIIEGQLVWEDDNGNAVCMTIDLLCKRTFQVKYKEMVEDGIRKRNTSQGAAGTMKYKEVVKYKEQTEYVIIDFKSNFQRKEKKSYYKSHIMQLIGAKRAVKQNFGIDVSGIFNFSPNEWRSEPTYTFKEHKLEGNEEEIFDARWNLIVAEGLNKPSGLVFMPGKLEHSRDFQYKSYYEYVRDVLAPDVDNNNNIPESDGQEDSQD